MKALHRAGCFSWSLFNEPRDLDFNSMLLTLKAGILLIDPLPLSAHDRLHLEQMGGVDWILVTNSDHLRESAALASDFGASVAGPAAEWDSLGIECDQWLKDGDRFLDELLVIEMQGSKTDGELCLLFDDTTLITGDLVRSQMLGRLNILPDGKLRDPETARDSVRRLAGFPEIETVLVGDGWHLPSGGHRELVRLVESF